MIEGRAPLAIKKALDPLIAFYVEFKPDVRRIVVPQDDYDRLLNCQKATLDRNGFQVINRGKVDQGVIYKGFALIRK